MRRVSPVISSVSESVVLLLGSAAVLMVWLAVDLPRPAATAVESRWIVWLLLEQEIELAMPLNAGEGSTAASRAAELAAMLAVYRWAVWGVMILPLALLMWVTARSFSMAVGLWVGSGACWTVLALGGASNPRTAALMLMAGAVALGLALMRRQIAKPRRPTPGTLVLTLVVLPLSGLLLGRAAEPSTASTAQWTRFAESAWTELGLHVDPSRRRLPAPVQLALFGSPELSDARVAEVVVVLQPPDAPVPAPPSGFVYRDQLATPDGRWWAFGRVRRIDPPVD